MSLVLNASKLSPAMSNLSLLWRIFLLHVDVAASQNLGLWFISIRRSATRGLSDDVAFLVDEFEVVAAEEVGNGGELRSVAGGVVVELEEGNSE